MRIPRLRLAALALTSGVILSGCAYDMYGNGYGYDPYGYGYGSGYPRSSVSIGIGYGGGYGGYGYGSYGYGYPYGGYYGGYDPFGWYGNYYYPGTGIYVYDRYRTRHVWNDDQRRYWENRRSRWQSRTGSTGTTTTQNWSGWDRSRWRDRNNATSTTVTTSNRPFSSSRQSGSSMTTRSERRSDGEHRSRERSEERPN